MRRILFPITERLMEDGNNSPFLVGLLLKLIQNSKPFFKEVEYGTGKITGESQTIRFKKNHTGTPTSVLLTYTEIASSVAGEPKNLKAFALSSTSFNVALSEFDGIERNFSWIAIW